MSTIVSTGMYWSAYKHFQVQQASCRLLEYDKFCAGEHFIWINEKIGFCALYV